ncbi:MAG: CNNM domain-containing protein [Thermoguttaceae bacterium]|jgi:CBS domain containing-hemolysin-like protein
MIWIVLGMAGAGLFLSAFFSGAETGFYRAVRLRLALDALEGDRVARGLLFLTQHPALFVATTLIGNALANYLVSAAIVAAAESLFPQWPYLAELLAPCLLAPLVFVYGELLPKDLFLQAPNRLLRRGGPLLLLFVVLFFPVGAVLWGLSRALGALLGQSPEPARLLLAVRELPRILEEGHEAGILYPVQRGLARGIFAVAQEPVTRFLAAREQLHFARSDMSTQEVLDLARRCRLPLVPVESAQAPGTLLGYLRVIDLAISASERPGPLRPLLDLGAECSHLSALMQMESAGVSLARVSDASGKMLGLVALQQLREPLLARRVRPAGR